MKTILLFSFICYVSSINWKDCGGSDAVWHYTKATFSPDPIVYPDPIDVELDVEITKDVPTDNLQLRVSIEKTTPKSMHIPCFNNFGSCNYDYCDYSKKNADSKDLFEAFAKIACPITAQKQSFNLPARTMPKLGEIFDKVMEGGFILNATYVNSKTGQVYGCVHAEFDVHLKS